LSKAGSRFIAIDLNLGVSMSGRVSLSATDRAEGAGAELLALCQTVTSDGGLEDREIVELAKWLRLNRLSQVPAVKYLLPIVEEIIKDRKVTEEEREALYKALEKILPPEYRTIAQMRRKEAKNRDVAFARAERDQNAIVDRVDVMVAGVAYEGRADVVRRYVRSGQQLTIAREPANPFSRNACQIRIGNGAMIGFVPENHAASLAVMLDGAYRYEAVVKKVIEGDSFPIPVVVIDVYGPQCTRASARLAERVTGQHRTGVALEPTSDQGGGVVSRIWRALRGD
jgi:hypothetical protein